MASRARDEDPFRGRDIIVEAVRNGDFVRVAAVDVETGLEAHAVGPANAVSEVEPLAVAKLKRRLQASLPKNKRAAPEGRPTPKGGLFV